MPGKAKKKGEASWPFEHIVKCPWPYMIILPVVFCFLIGFGWTQDDYVEEEVSNIWVATNGNYAKDTDYARSLDRARLSGTTIAAMAIARDGGNLFTESRLEEIRRRMQKTEATTIEYKGNNITWEDICGLNNVGRGTTYEFPCARLSPMDLFQEARWFFEEKDRLTWYDEVVGNRLLKPRIPRFGILQQSCAAQCQDIYLLRTNEAYALSKGYPASYANPLQLFSDLGNMEMNHPCRACIEPAFEATMISLTAYVQGAFAILAQEIGKLLQSGTVTDPTELQTLQQQAGRYLNLYQTTTRADAEEFFSYYTTRGLYAQLGAPKYIPKYNALMGGLGATCNALSATNPNLVCPSNTVDLPTAQFHLVNHADGEFSGLTAAGTPLPFWSVSDGSGNLFEGSLPVSGSGVDMKGDIFSMQSYLDLDNALNSSIWNPEYAPGLIDPTSTNFTSKVLGNPVYKWFMSSFDMVDTQCANGVLKGTSTNNAQFDGSTAFVMANDVSSSWCTKYNIPNSDNEGEGQYSKQHFAKMWYDLLIDSDTFLGLTQGEDDPYTWTSGQGCGYNLGGERDPYANKSDTSILYNASRELYYVDEGVTLGPVDRHLLIGGAKPSIEEYSMENPLENVGVAQSIYFGLLPKDIVDRVKNCNRPGGAIEDMTEEDAKDILEIYKEAFEDSWSEGWDKNDGEVQFVIFSDDSGAVGTTGRTLRQITLDNGKLMSVSIILIALFSVILLVSPDWIESRVLVTLIGVALVVLAFFASLGFAILIGIKINVTIAWTLPFIIMGIGVDDVYIVLMSLKKQGGYSRSKFLRAMREVAVPVTMTSVVNCLMFAVMNISDIPAIYKTATVATICIIALFLAVIFCFPAYCWLDMMRQEKGNRDVLFCLKAKNTTEDSEGKTEGEPPRADVRQVWLYEKFYYPVMFGAKKLRTAVHIFLFLGTAALLGVGIWGITEREVGLGLEDFYPTNSQAYRWASVRTEELASWSIGINWGALDYSDPDVQLAMIKQFEDVVATEHVSEIDTKLLWMADLLVWSSKHCEDNFDRSDAEVLECGENQMYEPDNTLCTATWVRNNLGLRNKHFVDPLAETCEPYEGGICRTTAEMFQVDLPSDFDEVLDNHTSWCPTVNWDDDKLKWCMTQWRNLTDFSGGRFVFESEDATETECAGEHYKDEELTFPIPFSSGPTMFSYDLFSHELTLDLIEQTRDVCDNNEKIHCWMTGIPYDYWEQYLDVFSTLLELAFISSAVGFGVAWIFLFAKLSAERRHPLKKVFWGTLIGALLIFVTLITSLIIVIGLSVLAGVSMTGFSNMAFVLSVAFAVEYAVHIVSRWLRAPSVLTTGLERVQFTMSFLMLPTFMSWISSTIGVICLAFTQFQFTEVFFFRPLIIVMMITYFIGCYVLPAFLIYLDFDVCRLGKFEESKSMAVLSKADQGQSMAAIPADVLEQAETGDEVPEATEMANDKSSDNPEETEMAFDKSSENLKDEPASTALGKE